MRLLATLTLLTVMVQAAACAQQPEPSSEFVVNRTYIARLTDNLDYQRSRQVEEFANDLDGTHRICLVGSTGQSCRRDSRAVEGFTVAFSRCRPLSIKNDKHRLELCEYLIERVSDKAKLGCARVTGWFPGHHAEYKSSEVRMHFDEKGNWKLGFSPEEVKESARIVEEDREALEAGKFVPIRMAPRYSNLHCQSDPNKFF